MTWPGQTTTSVPIGTDPTFIPYQPNEGTGYTTPPTGYQFWPTDPPVCSCEYSGRHTWLRHWLRMRYMKRAW